MNSTQTCFSNYMSADCISAFGSVGQFLVVFSAFVYTILSIDSWRKPTLAQRRADIAVDILLNAAKVKEELLFIRREVRLADALTSRAELAHLRLNELRDVEPIVDRLASAGIKQKIIIGNAAADAAILDIIRVEEGLRQALTGLAFGGLGVRELDEERRGIAFETDRESDVTRTKLRKAYATLDHELRGLVDLQ